jgi:hypothetical protein
MKASVHVRSGRLERREWPEPWAGAGELLGLVTHRLPLARLEEGVALMRRQEAVKVYVTP